MIFPFMAIYFVKTIGPIATSVFLSIAVIINFIASIFGGSIADKVGRKKVMVIADALRVVTFIMFALSNSPWFDWPYVTLLFFMVNNVCSGLYSPASEAMLLDVSTSEERKYMYSVMYWISNLSIALGGTIGALFFSDYLFVLFVILSIASIVSTLITLFFITETYFPKEGAAKNGDGNKKLNEVKGLLQNYKEVVRDRIFILFVLSSTLLFSLEAHLTNFISIRLERDISERVLHPFQWKMDGIELLGILRAENTICVVLFSVIATWFIRKYNEKSILFFGFALYVIGYGVLSYSDSPWILISMMVFAVIGEVIAFPIHQSYLGDIIPDHLRSSYLAMNRIAMKGSSLIGTLGIYIASVLPTLYVSLFVWLSGIIALLLFYSIIPAIYERRSIHEQTYNVNVN